MKGEYFMMKNHGLRRFFSLLLALIMVCALLPTAALAEDTTGDGETQTVVVDEKKPEPPAQEDPETFTVTYTDGANGAAFDEQVYPDLSSGTATPAFNGPPEWKGYTFVGWKPAVAETVTGDVTYVAQWEVLLKAPRSNSTVVLRPSVGNTVTGVKVAVGGTLSGYTITSINGYDITVDLGKYNVNNGTFRLPYAKDIWYGVDDNKVDYISWAGSGSNKRSEGANALLANGKNTAYYYFKGTSTKPAAPSEADVKNLLGNSAVKVHCSTPNSGHADVTYPLLDGSFTVGDVQGSSGNYTCVVTVTADSYVTAYGGGHRLAAANESPKTITLKYNETTKTWAAQTVIPIVFNVVCDTTPTAPDDGTVKDLLGENAVQIICTNTQIGHGSKTFGLIDGTFSVYHNKNNCEVVINYFSPYVDAFNAAVNVPAETHITDNSNAGQNRTKINLVWSDGKWTPVDTPAKYHVLYNLQPAAPTAPSHDDLSRLIGDITVNCTNDAATHTPKSKGYALIADSYTIGAQGVDAINAAYPVPPLENVDANFQAMAAATTDFVATCDGQGAAISATVSLYNSNSQSFSDSESLPPQGSGYIVLMLMVPKNWKELQVTYMPTFAPDKTLTFTMKAADVIRG